jgi:primosomal protein N' (replication factor Y)
MKLYNILPATKTSHTRSEFFTYGSEKALSRGDLVQISLGRQQALGVVLESTEKSSPFHIKRIDQILTPKYLQEPYIELLWMGRYYHVSLGLLLSLFLTGYPKTGLQGTSETKSAQHKPEVSPKLTNEQSFAVDAILRTCHEARFRSFLLLGVTGSGKTEVYTQICAKRAEQNFQSLILVPEIALTPQVVERFARRVQNVVVYHSKLTQKQKREVLMRVRSKEPISVIGARSALFLPFRSLGVIIVDEEHDSSFQQFDKTPRYDARVVAEELGRRLHIPVVFGDATPQIETYHRAKTGDMTLLPLTKRISLERDDIPLPEIVKVDFVSELKNGNKSPLSRLLQNEIDQTLKKREQVFLFLNRRGYASSMLCFSCRHIVSCRNCSTPLVLHGNTLLCHHCGFHAPLARECPSCGKQSLRTQGLGTERIEMEVKKLFPRARVARIDGDTMRHRKHYQDLYHKLMSHEIDIIIGTQMIAQGFDIPQVSLVGIIQVDSMLNLPDFHSEERVYQILTQVSGRAGRRHTQGKVILQTFFPDHWVFDAVATHQYETFYQKEIQVRRQFSLPPLTHFIQLTYHAKSDHAAHTEAEHLASALRKSGREIFGPTPAFIPKKRGEWYWQILLCVKKVADVPFDIIPESWDSTIDPQSLLS